MGKARRDIVVGFIGGWGEGALSKRIAIDTFHDEPIGILPDGTINFVKVDDPPFEPKVCDSEGRLLSDRELKASRL
jgi:hypothetical protein